MTDWQLLQQYLHARSQEAFAQLVHRHIGWVRSSALRQVRDAHLADDVAQAVFLALAQQAHRLHEGVALSTWLFKVTHYAASTALRAESRRKRHERQAAMTSSTPDSATMTAEQWAQLSLKLDALVARLRGDDQRAVLLRFYQQKSYPDMAAALGVSEEAARKRTDRAVGKLRQLIGRRELTLSADALSAGLLAHATAPVSPTLASAAIEIASHGGTAAAGAAAASTPIAAIAKGAIQMMNLARLRLPLAACLAMLLLTAAAITLVNAASKPLVTTQGTTRPATPVAAAVAAPAAAPAAADANASPKAVVIAAFRAAAAGDADGLIGRFDRVTPAQADTLKQVAQLMSAADQFSRAVAETLAADVDPDFNRTIGSGVGEADLTAAGETVNGDTAIVDVGTGPGQIPLIRSDKQWKISAEVLRTLNPNAVRQFSVRVPALNQLTADIRAGKYKTVAELRQAVEESMRPQRRRPTTAAATAPTAPTRTAAH